MAMASQYLPKIARVGADINALTTSKVEDRVILVGLIDQY